jgi:hypothetical protein
MLADVSDRKHGRGLYQVSQTGLCAIGHVWRSYIKFHLALFKAVESEGMPTRKEVILSGENLSFPIPFYDSVLYSSVFWVITQRTMV